MSESNTPSSEESTEANGAAKKPATRRRATATSKTKATTPAAKATTTKAVTKTTTTRTTRSRAATKSAEPVAEPTQPEAETTQPAAEIAEVPAKKPATRRRAAAKKPTAVTPAEQAEAPDTEAIEVVEEAPVVKKPATRRRSTKKPAPAPAPEAEPLALDAPAQEDALESVVAEAEAAADAEAAEEAPVVKKPATRRRSTKKAAPAPAPEAEPLALDAPAQEDALESVVAEAEAAADAEAAEEDPAAAEAEASAAPASPFDIPVDSFGLLFQAPDLSAVKRAEPTHSADHPEQDVPEEGTRRRRRRRRGTEDMEIEGGEESDPPGTVTRVRAPRSSHSEKPVDHVVAVKGSTRLEAKRQRRRESRESGRRRHGISEAEFLARRESVDRQMVVRQQDQRIQIGVLEDGVLAEHFVSHTTQDSLIGNVYVGKVQNVLPSMEAAFVDIGRGRNAVLYAGEVDWDAAKLDGKPRRIENALKSGDSVLVQVSKDPVGHKGARLTSQISLPGRYLVYVPGGSMTGISRKLPDVERNRLKKILKDHLPDKAGVIVRTAAEGASEQELMNDINRLRAQWEGISGAATSTKTRAPELLYSEPDLMIKVVRDVFNEDFSKLVVQGDNAWDTIEAYVTYVAPDLVDRLERWSEDEDVFAKLRLDEQIRKALERKVNLPSGGSLVIDRTEAMTVIDVNTGKFTGSGGNLEETVTKNNLEAAEEIVRQMRLRDMGGIIVVDFIDMVLESNRDLVLRRLVECLGRDRTKHQVAEVTSLGLVQMTRKKIGTGLLEVFSEPCEHCDGRGVVIADEPVEGRQRSQHVHTASERPSRSERRKQRQGSGTEGDKQSAASDQPAEAKPAAVEPSPEEAERTQKARAALANIAAASGHAGETVKPDAPAESAQAAADVSVGDSEAHGFEDGEDDGRPRRRRRRGRRGRGGRVGEENNEAQQDADEVTAEPEPEQAGEAEPAAREPAAPEPVSGVARSLSGAERAERAEAAGAAAAAASSGAASAKAPRRRRRAASSEQGSESTQTVAQGEAEGTTVSSGQAGAAGPADAASQVAARPAATAEPIMLGVGVPASEL